MSSARPDGRAAGSPNHHATRPGPVTLIGPCRYSITGQASVQAHAASYIFSAASWANPYAQPCPRNASIPREPEEAAWLDGTGRLGALTRVVLPLAMPGVVTALVYTFIGAWNEHVVALTVTSSSNRTTLTRAISGFVTSYHEQWQYLFATSLVAIVPVVVLFVFVERHLVAGLTAGGVRG